MITLIKDYWEGLCVVAVVVGAAFTAYVRWRGLKSTETLRDEYQRSFDKVVTDLSSDNRTSQLTAAILLRRFFSINEMKEEKTFLKDETINVISSLLRTLQTGVFQKTVADGLAYAVDLQSVDLQRTNLQDVCLEGKSQRLNLNGADMFMADMSFALIKNADAVGAYFYNAILLKARFKKCNLRNADFRNADLSNVKFDKVDLYMANLTGALNIPDEIKNGIKDYKEEAVSLSKRYQEVGEVTTSDKKSSGNIFFSIPGCATIEDNALIHEYHQMLEGMNYNVICYTRDQYPQYGQLNRIRHDIMQSSGMVVFGLKQIRVDKATYRPSTEEEQKWEETKWLPTPWNDIEVGLGAMLGLPILLVKDADVNSGIFDSHLSECFIAKIPSSYKVDKVKGEKEFNLWLSKIN